VILEPASCVETLGHDPPRYRHGRAPLPDVEVIRRVQDEMRHVMDELGPPPKEEQPPANLAA
jgi:hypothetical protein